MKNLQIMAEIRDGRFSELELETTDLLPMDIQFTMDSKGIGRGIGVYTQPDTMNDNEFGNYLHGKILDEYNLQRQSAGLACW